MERILTMWPGRIITVLFTGLLMLSCNTRNQKYTRGTGIYPGDPDENFSPELRVDSTHYRNLALLRPAWHSGSYDYNLTAQLITDGIITSKVPYYFSLTTNQGVVPKREREWVLDHVTGSADTLVGSNVWLQFEIGGDEKIPEVTSIEINGTVTYDEKLPEGWGFKVSGSDDGRTWEVLDQVKGSGLPGTETPNRFAELLKNAPKDSIGKPVNPLARILGPNNPNEPKPSFTFHFPLPQPSRTLRQVFKFKKPVQYRIYRVDLDTHCGRSWAIGDFDFFDNNKLVEMAPSHKFSSAWMSAGTGKEWVCVDLGVKSSIDLVKLFWVNKAISGEIQVSDDGMQWEDAAGLPGTENNVDDIALSRGVSARYVRVMMERSANKGRYILSEMQVMGKGGLVPVPKPAPAVKANRMELAGGNWKIQRASEVASTGEVISKPGFDNSAWVVATVPGTALVSYRNAGALPDPNFADNQLMISESFFNSDFWYRDEFDVPAGFKDKKMFLNFDGINWKADVFVNGKKTGNIKGAFIRGKFDVSDLITPGQKNVVAVLIRKNDNIGCIKEQTAYSPDKNGGILGADNPTFHATAGWDWIPTIRGRDIGIWNDVYLTTNGGVTIGDPLVTTDLPLPDTSSADISIGVPLTNHLSTPVTGKLKGSYGDVSFEENVSLGAAEAKVIKLTPANHPELHIQNPELWWPNGYGKQYLYDVKLSFVSNSGDVLDQDAFKSGIREMAYDDTNNILSIYVNGRRLIARGGNWGFSESNLEYRGREYDAAVKYHADMNFTMIRNWVGQTGDDEFYEACDKYGIMVWQDFWLANPVDGPNPYDPQMFLDNAEDMIRRIRNHPSIAIYVGRNEGNPPPVIDTMLRKIIPELNPGIHYIPNSAGGSVSGGGPYRALPVRDYFLLYGRDKLHSERGMPNVVTYESLKLMLPEDALWPQNSLWGMHDYCLDGAQRASSFNQMVQKGFGRVNDAETFTERAQWINYNGYRAMFEGRSRYRRGLLLWMSHPAWPSMVWQTYDYYLAPTAAYFGCKKACEPIHIQWNPVYDSIEVVNLNARDQKGLTARAQIINMDGSVQWEKEATLNSNEDTTDRIFKLEFPDGLSAVHFIKLTLKKGDKLLSDNFYWRGREQGNYRALNDLPQIKLSSKTSVKHEGEDWFLKTTLTNATKTPALMIRLMVAGEKSGERILPALYSDNYISLMPGETKTIKMSVKNEDTRGENPVVVISGFNLE